jgi:hypothetical protein
VGGSAGTVPHIDRSREKTPPSYTAKGPLPQAQPNTTTPRKTVSQAVIKHTDKSNMYLCISAITLVKFILALCHDFSANVIGSRRIPPSGTLVNLNNIIFHSIPLKFNIRIYKRRKSSCGECDDQSRMGLRAL